MKNLFLFFLINSILFGIQTHNDKNSATVPVHVNVFVIPNAQQLKIVDEQGIQQDSVVINHFISPDFQGEDISQATFFVQRGSNESNQIRLSSEIVEVQLEKEGMVLIGNQTEALETELVVEKSANKINNQLNRIENKVTSRIIKNSNVILNPNEQYSGEINMTVTLKKIQ